MRLATRLLHRSARDAEGAKSSGHHITRAAQRRFFGGSSGDSGRSLRELNRRGDPEGVIRSFESGSHGFTEEGVKEYVKALVAVDRLDRSMLFKTLQAGMSAQQHHPPPTSPPLFQGGGGASGGYFGGASTSSAAAGVGGLLSGGAKTDLGTAQAPVHVTQAEPSFKAQFWRSIRSLGLAFIVISGIGALMEDKSGVPGRFLSGNAEVRPVLESDTKFEDVKGVDEAKAELVEIVEYLKGPERFTRLGGKLPKVRERASGADKRSFVARRWTSAAHPRSCSDDFRLTFFFFRPERTGCSLGRSPRHWEDHARPGHRWGSRRALLLRRGKRV